MLAHASTRTVSLVQMQAGAQQHSSTSGSAAFLACLWRVPGQITTASPAPTGPSCLAESAYVPCPW